VADRAEGLDQLATLAVSALDRAVSKGVLHRNNAARRKSRLMKRLQATGQAPAPAPVTPARATTRTTRAKATTKR